MVTSKIALASQACFPVWRFPLEAAPGGGGCPGPAPKRGRGSRALAPLASPAAAVLPRPNLPGSPQDRGGRAAREAARFGDEKRERRWRQAGSGRLKRQLPHSQQRPREEAAGSPSCHTAQKEAEESPPGTLTPGGEAGGAGTQPEAGSCGPPQCAESGPEGLKPRCLARKVRKL